ncbi:MAG: hypothetical protein EHM14_13105 [Methanothrix sp.]|nr:MAG: hypothetical protein EHM14_13105 [Methanothrix sp.]
MGKDWPGLSNGKELSVSINSREAAILASYTPIPYVKYMKFNYKMMFERGTKIKPEIEAVIHQGIFSDLRYIFLLFFGTRIILTLIGVLSRILLEPYHGKEYVWVYSDKLWLDIWGV